MANGPSYFTMPNAGGGFASDLLQRAMAALDARRPQEAERIAAEILVAQPHQGRAAEAITPLEAAMRGR